MRAIEVTDRANAGKSRLLEAGAGCREPIVITTGANLRRVPATAMMMHGRSDVVLAMTGSKVRIKTRETATTILAGPTAIGLHPVTISELQSYFELRLEAARGEPMHPLNQGFLRKGHEVFAAARFIAMYHRWLKHRNAVDDEFRVCGKRAFEKTVVGFVPDDNWDFQAPGGELQHGP